MMKGSDSVGQIDRESLLTCLDYCERYFSLGLEKKKKRTGRYGSSSVSHWGWRRERDSFFFSQVPNNAAQLS